MIKSLDMWLQLRPTADEVHEAMSQLKTLTLLTEMYGTNPDYEAVKNVIEWVFLSHQIPLVWVEKKVQEELSGTSRDC